MNTVLSCSSLLQVFRYSLKLVESLLFKVEVRYLETLGPWASRLSAQYISLLACLVQPYEVQHTKSRPRGLNDRLEVEPSICFLE